MLAKAAVISLSERVLSPGSSYLRTSSGPASLASFCYSNMSIIGCSIASNPNAIFRCNTRLNCCSGVYHNVRSSAGVTSFRSCLLPGFSKPTHGEIRLQSVGFSLFSSNAGNKDNKGYKCFRAVPPITKEVPIYESQDLEVDSASSVVHLSCKKATRKLSSSSTNSTVNVHGVVKPNESFVKQANTDENGLCKSTTNKEISKLETINVKEHNNSNELQSGSEILKVDTANHPKVKRKRKRQKNKSTERKTNNQNLSKKEANSGDTEIEISKEFPSFKGKTLSDIMLDEVVDNRLLQRNKVNWLKERNTNKNKTTKNSMLKETSQSRESVTTKNKPTENAHQKLSCKSQQIAKRKNQTDNKSKEKETANKISTEYAGGKFQSSAGKCGRKNKNATLAMESDLQESKKERSISLKALSQKTAKRNSKRMSSNAAGNQELSWGDDMVLNFSHLLPGKSIVVVESPSKAQTIQKYLGKMFKVLATYGHVRGLARRSGSVSPKKDFNLVWEVPDDAWKHIKTIKQSLIHAKNLVLATDPDREGEAIAWHVCEMLKLEGKFNKKVVRITFTEITKSAIFKAIESPRDIDMNLVNASLARNALDYLIGFGISPILWRKLPACQSAGRVQSSALSLICDREKEIENFSAQEYWTVEAQVHSTESVSDEHPLCLAKVTHVDGKKLDKFSIASEAEAKEVAQTTSSAVLKVLDVKRSSMTKSPPLPYITSSLQRDASNKLNFNASYTMMLAQKLYEGVRLSNGETVGLITYMRTDGIRISDEVGKSIHSFITERYGQAYAFNLDSLRTFDKKIKNAQEAHESIRPTDIRRSPSSLENVLERDALKLYSLIWCKTMACQMQGAKLDTITVSFGMEDGSLSLNSSGSTIVFPGYLAIYKDNEALGISGEDSDEEMADDKYFVLCKFKVGDCIKVDKVDAFQHFTEPLPRYSEGSLVKKLEELGIGRPSTYASIMKTLQARGYVDIRSRRIHPELRGRMLSVFLSRYFDEIVNLGFTAYMESQLDDISAGDVDWKHILGIFWKRFSKDCEHAKNIDISEVEQMIEQNFKHAIFHGIPESRECPGCSVGTVRLKVSRHGLGYFIGCNRYPACSFIARTFYRDEKGEERLKDTDLPNKVQDKLLGIDPTSKLQVLLKCGPYGYYIQLGEEKKGSTPKRVNLSEMKDADSITVEKALQLLKYPIFLGKHPETNEDVILSRGKLGYFIRHVNRFSSLPKDVDPENITLELAVEYLRKSSRGTGRPKTSAKPTEGTTSKVNKRTLQTVS